jgi:serine protease inhibitor
MHHAVLLPLQAEVHEVHNASCLRLSALQAEVREVHDERPINKWAARVTRGLIPTAVPHGLKFDLLLTNAIYFKGEAGVVCKLLQ